MSLPCPRLNASIPIGSGKRLSFWQFIRFVFTGRK
jgi:hypothetical protein